MGTSDARGGQSPPKIVTPDWDGFPQELRGLSRWVLWKYENRGDKWTKVPKQANGDTNGSSTDPATWLTFDRVRKIDLEARGCGAGFVFNGDGLIGIDLDDAVLINGVCTFKPWAQEIVDKFKGSYMEWSPSHKGIHILCRGKLRLPNGAVAVRNADGELVGKLERYADGRFFTMTGDSL